MDQDVFNILVGAGDVAAERPSTAKQREFIQRNVAHVPLEVRQTLGRMILAEGLGLVEFHEGCHVKMASLSDDLVEKIYNMIKYKMSAE